MKQFGYAFMRDILEDKEGNIWVATMGNGVFRYQPQTDETVNYLHIEGDSTSIGTNESDRNFGRQPRFSLVFHRPWRTFML